MAPETFLLSSGGRLQLAGITAVAYEVYVAARKLHDDTPFWRRLRGWRPFRRQPKDQTVGTGAAVEQDMALSARGTSTPPPGLTLSQRVDLLEGEVKRISNDVVVLHDAHTGLAEKVDGLDTKFEDLETRIDEIDRDLRKLIDAAQAGHVPLRVFGAWALFFGVILATWYDPIADHGFRPAVVLFVATVMAGFSPSSTSFAAAAAPRPFRRCV
jgi:hypothetical protein